MTANIAWIQGDSVYLVADTAETRVTAHVVETLGDKPQFSSFGQRVTDDRGNTVRERVAKIVRVGDRALASLCGRQPAPARFVDALKTFAAESNTSVREAIEAAHAGVCNVDGSYQSIIAYYDEGPRLAVSSSKDPFSERTELGWWCWGSLSWPRVERLFAQILKLPDTSPAAHLTAGLAVVQQLGLVEDLIPDLVGGAFFGARVGPDGSRWQEDTLYGLYNPGFLSGAPVLNNIRDLNLESAIRDLHVEPAVRDGSAEPVDGINWVRCRVIDESMIAQSTLTGRAHCMIDDPTAVGRDDFLRTHGTELETYRSLFEARRLVFIPILPGRIVVLPDVRGYLRCFGERVALSSSLATELSECIDPVGYTYRLHR